ncbi:MAG: hypothetical protein N2689_09470 [Verrucomicrobiae bacterium]|nr:hypothetical protein [Verrucomicrobiae bacterium]
MLAVLLAATLNVAFTISNGTPVARQRSLVCAELTLPAGAATDITRLRVVGYDQLSVPAQISALEHWPDKSLKTVRVLFVTNIEPADSKTWTLTGGRSTARDRYAAKVVMEDGQPVLSSGILQYRVGELLGPLTLQTAAASGRDATALDQLFKAVIERNEVEEPGPVRATVRRDGWLARGTDRFFRCTERFSVVAGQPGVRVAVRIEAVDGTDPAQVSCVALDFRPNLPLKSVALATASGVTTLAPTDARRLAQPVVPARLVSDRQHPGWIDWRGGGSAVLFAVKHFWQRAPKALDIRGDGSLRCELRSSDTPPLALTRGAAMEDDMILWFHPLGAVFDEALVELNHPLEPVVRKD